MSSSLDNLFKYQSILYKYFLYIASIFLIVSFFPRGGKFKYEFQKGKPWQYENLYAPFDFAIVKTEDELAEDKAKLKANKIVYYAYDEIAFQEIQDDFKSNFEAIYGVSNISSSKTQKLFDQGNSILQDIYQDGIFDSKDFPSSQLRLVRNNEARTIGVNSVNDINWARNEINRQLNASNLREDRQVIRSILLKVIKPNVAYDKDRTEKFLNEEISQISITKDNVQEGKLIIAKGEVVESGEFQILNSLKIEYESELWKGANYYFILVGYVILVALVLMMIFFFLKNYRHEIFINNNKLTFIFVNVLIMVFFTTLVVKTNENYVYAVPICILPLVLKNFFDARLGLFVHVLTSLILGFVVPNSFEYIFLQIIAGIVTILGATELHKRTNLFIAVGQITLIYIVGYIAFHIIHEGAIGNIDWSVLVIFLLNGMITLFAQPLIYLYEKIFGLVSDVSLLELSDTNSKLLKQLSDTAPGTFHHSLQVANLAEAACNEIGANALLARVGALYHDIGKMMQPTFFTENQITNVNPHDDLPPKESAKIILEHVIKGIEIARKNGLPDRVIDFIRTHHGTSLVYYFYKKQKEVDENTMESDFRYPGPIPFSRETAILMMSDAVEAASKSLKSPTYIMIDEFVERIVNGQMKENQYLNADITFKEIEAVKKVLKQKLINIYHLRVEYPE